MQAPDSYLEEALGWATTFTTYPFIDFTNADILST